MATALAAPLPPPVAAQRARAGRAVVPAGDPEVRRAIGHVLRRATFGPRPGEIDAFVPLVESGGIDALVTALLDAPPMEVTMPELGGDDDWGLGIQWWLQTMARPDAGLHEKLVLFWHGHLTSSLDKVGAMRFMLRQHDLLRRHALGNFREMVAEITIDPAMLEFLDGNWSSAEAPNENYSRELMELYALGRFSGAYTEADVRAGAKALAGWQFEWDSVDFTPEFNPDSGLTAPVSFLGRDVSTAREVVDAVCDHPACAPYVAERMFLHFAGVAPSDDARAQLGATFADSGLEIRPLIEAVLRHPEFHAAVGSRPRFPIEWYIAAVTLLDVPIGGDDGADHWVLDSLGQQPFNPPNVAGWPVSTRWFSVGAALSKATFGRWTSEGTATLDDDDPVGDVLWRAGLDDVSATTRAALDQAAATLDGDRWAIATALHALVVASPEFSIA
jgi:uncharacterized protein (DUF1800 family)